MIHQFKAEQTEANLNFDIHLTPNKQVYCFIGENACGKTQLLQNIAKSLVYCSSIFVDKESKKYKEIFWEDKVTNSLKPLTIYLPTDVIINDISIKSKEADSWNITSFDTISFNSSNGTKRKYHFDYPIIFIGTKNRGYTSNINKDKVKILGDREEKFLEGFNRSFLYMNGNAVTDNTIAEWFTARTIIDSSFMPEKEKPDNEVIAILELIKKLEPSMAIEPKEFKKAISYSQGRLLFDSVPIDKLSTGFVSVIKIFQEIIAGYAGWAGMVGETDLRNMEGVVFIDEIESHLHAKWQYKIIPLLKEFFPKTTFYIATHSPLIVGTTDEDEAYELIRVENNVTAKKLGNPQEWYLAEIYSQAFHVDITSINQKKTNGKPPISEMFKNFSVKVKDYTVQKDESLKQEIENLYEQILPSLSENDPRRSSLVSLKSLVK